MDKMFDTLMNGLETLQLPLDPDCGRQLCALGQAVVEQNKVMNLTAITEPEAVAKLHLLDSVALLKCVDLRGKKLIDVGCGAGFPGVPVKIACPGVQLTLLDSLGKRMTWLRDDALPRLGVEAECITARAEEFAQLRRESYDFASSRAVARLNILLELTAPFVKVGGAVLAMKGSAAAEELEEAKNAIRQLGLQLEKVHHFPVDGADHAIIVLRKIRPTPAQYPRKFNRIKQLPL